MSDEADIRRKERVLEQILSAEPEFGARLYAFQSILNKHGIELMAIRLRVPEETEPGMSWGSIKIEVE